MGSHLSALTREVLDYLNVQEGGKYIDATLGGGGHAEAILEKGGEVLGLDFDPQALEMTRKRLTLAYPTRWQVVHSNFVQLKELVHRLDYKPVKGILFDLGISSLQLDDPERGFSFASPYSLDMRLDPKGQTVTAKDLINGLNEGELDELFSKLGEEKNSRQLARAICIARRVKPIETGLELGGIIKRVVRKPGKVHPATNVFRALRMAVNDELGSLTETLPQALEILASRGRLVVISFHSLEERIVKNFFREKSGAGVLKILTEKPVVAMREEIVANPRARSAKLRAIEKI